MPKSIGILFVASEVEPFIKTGSVGDLAGSLPKNVKALGHDIRVMLPSYSLINNRRFQIHNLLRMQDIEVPVGDLTECASVKSSYLNSETQKVLVYFLTNERYFNRDGLYFHPDTKKYFPDNDERFIFFCRGVLETLKRLRWQPEIIHCVDWQCALIPAYLNSLYQDDPYFRNVKTVLTVASLASHATFPKTSSGKTGLPKSTLGLNGKNGEKLNFLNIGLSNADVITTFGNKADKSLLIAPQNDMLKVLGARSRDVVSMTTEGHNGNAQENLARKFVDIYRELVKHN